MSVCEIALMDSFCFLSILTNSVGGTSLEIPFSCTIGRSFRAGSAVMSPPFSFTAFSIESLWSSVSNSTLIFEFDKVVTLDGAKVVSRKLTVFLQVFKLSFLFSVFVVTTIAGLSLGFSVVLIIDWLVGLL